MLCYATASRDRRVDGLLCASQDDAISVDGGASVATGAGGESRDRDTVLRSLNVSDGTLALLRKLVRSVPPVETACMEADECISALEADFQ